jgi:hypothetical protein
MRRLGYSLLIVLTCVLGVVLGPSRQSVRAQGAQPAVLVIDGGTLIDGNGGAPVRDAQVVIEGNKITRIGRKGQARPNGAQVINGDGKFIVPGLIDALTNFLWYQGEIYLNNGVTSYVGIGDMGEVGVVRGGSSAEDSRARPIDWAVHFVGPPATRSVWNRSSTRRIRSRARQKPGVDQAADRSRRLRHHVPERCGVA